MPWVVLVHGLKVVCAQHENDQVQGRVDFHTLGQTRKPVTPGFERVIPDGAPPVQAVFYNSNLVASRDKRDFHDARPAEFECETLPCVWNDPP
jgi:hypothetical protein